MISLTPPTSNVTTGFLHNKVSTKNCGKASLAHDNVNSTAE